jgi:hypothetical protein
MPSTASATDPVSHYEAFSTLWAAARSARGTDLRGESLINLDVLSTVPESFVAELPSKLRPASIEHGLSQAGSGQSPGIDIADEDTPVFAHEPRGQLVQEMLATVRDLRVNSPRARLASSPLCDGERPLVFAVDAWRLDLRTRREGDQGFEPKIDANLTEPMVAVFWHLDLQIQVPAAAGVLAKAAAENPPLDGAAEPEPVSPSQEDHRVALQSNGTRRLEGDPPQGFSAAPSGPLAVGISRERELFADSLHSVRVQAKELAAAAGKVDQIKARGPKLVVPSSGVLDLTAIVPDSVHLLSLSPKMRAGARILDPIPIRKQHLDKVAGTCKINNPDAKFSRELVRFYSRSLSGAASVCRVTRMRSAHTNATPRRSTIGVFQRQFAIITATESTPPTLPQCRGLRRGEFG